MVDFGEFNESIEYNLLRFFSSSPIRLNCSKPVAVNFLKPYHCVLDIRIYSHTWRAMQSHFVWKC